MKIYDFDNTMFIKLGDLSHLVRQMGMEDREQLKTLSRMMDRILENRLKTCEDGEEAKALYERVDDEFYIGKFVVLIHEDKAEDGEIKKHMRFFQRFSTEKVEAMLREAGKTEEEIQYALYEDAGEPVFCDRAFHAEFFEDYGFAASIASHLKHARGMDAEVGEAWMFSPNAIRRLKKMVQEWKEEDAKEKEVVKS